MAMTGLSFSNGLLTSNYGYPQNLNITQAQNGFIVNANSMTYVAKSEKELFSLISKLFKGEQK